MDYSEARCGADRGAIIRFGADLARVVTMPAASAAIARRIDPAGDSTKKISGLRPFTS